MISYKYSLLQQKINVKNDLVNRKIIQQIMQLDLEVKQQLEEIFTFKSLLGQGSFGCVFECQDKRDNQIYAVKIISKSNVKKSKMECLRQEARLLSSINHPNIVKVYEFVETNTFIFLRMEIIRNGTLEKLIKDRWSSGIKFTDDQMAAIMGSIFRSLNYIHSMNIIHRDIKPQNILIPCYDDFSKLKMADFGLSTKLDFYYPKTATSKCGTMLYMAPEILNNLSYSKSVDIWSCSIIMFHLASGKHPFYQNKMTTQDYKRKIRNVIFPPLTNKLAQDFLARISKVEANQRYTTQQALKHPWLTRKLDDQIPQSLHQSFLGFQKSHTISNLLKFMIATKSIVSTNSMPKLPDSYIQKVENQNNCFVGLNLQKKRSKRQEKQQNLSLNSLKSSTINSEKQSKQNQDTVYDKDTPAIAKLNAIFDTLLQRKNRHKQKFYTQNIVAVHENNKKQTIESPPKQIPFKQKIENEIEKLVREFKAEQTSRTANQQNNIRRMLPQNKKKTEKIKGEKEEFRMSLESNGSASQFKIRYRKKNNVMSKLYD